MFGVLLVYSEPLRKNTISSFNYYVNQSILCMYALKERGWERGEKNQSNSIGSREPSVERSKINGHEHLLHVTPRLIIWVLEDTSTHLQWVHTHAHTHRPPPTHHIHALFSHQSLQ